MLKKTEEGLDRRQPDIATADRIGANRLEMLQKGGHQRRIEVLETERRRGDLEPLAGKLKQQTKTVGVRLAGVRARAALVSQMVPQEGRDVGRDGGHMVSSPSKRPHRPRRC